MSNMAGAPRIGRKLEKFGLENFGLLLALALLPAGVWGATTGSSTSAFRGSAFALSFRGPIWRNAIIRSVTPRVDQPWWRAALECSTLPARRAPVGQ